MIPNVITFTLKRRKIYLLFLGLFLSVVLGSLEFYLFTRLELGGGKYIMLFLSIVSLVYAVFSIASLIWLKKERQTGIYISDEGINDISTGHNIGTILWKDVEQVKIMTEIGRPDWKYVVLKVSDPNEYIFRERSPSKRRTLELKLQYYGSPICFSNRALNCTFDQLKDAVILKYEHYKTAHPS